MACRQTAPFVTLLDISRTCPLAFAYLTVVASFGPLRSEDRGLLHVFAC
jgi:hypothetical protein